MCRPGLTYFISVVHLATNSLGKLIADKIGPSLVRRQWLYKWHFLGRNGSVDAQHGIVQVNWQHLPSSSRHWSEIGQRNLALLS